jgi:hypothetical protein
MHKWRRPSPIVQGWTRAFSVSIAARDVVRPKLTRHKLDPKIQWFPRPVLGMATLFDVFIADAGVDLRQVPGSDSMGTRLVFDAPLATSETLCLLIHQEPASNDSRFRRRVASTAAAAIAAQGGRRPEDIRGFATVVTDDGTLAFVDLAVDPPPADL